jgi:hypothetical protein
MLIRSPPLRLDPGRERFLAPGRRRLAPPKSGGKDTFGVDTQIHFSYTQNVPKILIITENRGAKEGRASGYAARCALGFVFNNRLEKMGREL